VGTSEAQSFSEAGITLSRLVKAEAAGRMTGGLLFL
jgi:hypothetical protein